MPITTNDLLDEDSALVQNAAAALYNGLGQYDQALSAAERADEHPGSAATLVLPELIEAACRSGKTERAVSALGRLTRAARSSGTDWAVGMQARSQALLSDGRTADGLYQEAIERFGLAGRPQSLARARLIYGEWLRREGRRVDAREQLRRAHAMLTELGLDAFAARACRELLATGESVRKRSAGSESELTPQEAQIARLAGEGFTNPEIGGRLFLSPRTVEWHLRKVFFKLDIGSRKELRAT
jgi:DNA-binding CsgD family transcriptional regulator